MLASELRDLVHVHEAVLPTYVIGDGAVVAAGEGLRRVVGRMAAMSEVEAEHGVARLAQRMQHGRVGVRA